MPGTGTSPEREQVPLFDLRLTEEDLVAIEAVLRSGRLSSGPAVEAFEAKFAAHLGVEHCVAVSSCTAALHLAYLAAGIGPGDEVIVPALTFAATGAAVVYCGGVPVFADVIGPSDLSIDVDDVRARITPRTKAVAVVHFAGYPAPVDELRALCDAHGLALIEDVAHAPSAAGPDGRKLGTYGLAGCFSFFSNKVLSCGEGGLLATSSAEVASLARATRSGPFNYRFDEVRAALLTSRMDRLEEDIAARRARTHRYRAALAGVDGVVVPYTDASVDRSSCYVMPIVLEELGVQGPLRIALREEHRIQTSLLYPGTHEFTAYRDRFPASLPRTERVSRTEVTLPLYAHMTDEEQDRVLDALVAELPA